jgi:hypothetical protein
MNLILILNDLARLFFLLMSFYLIRTKFSGKAAHLETAIFFRRQTIIAALLTLFVMLIQQLLSVP